MNLQTEAYTNMWAHWKHTHPSWKPFADLMSLWTKQQIQHMWFGLSVTQYTEIIRLRVTAINSKANQSLSKHCGKAHFPMILKESEQITIIVLWKKFAKLSNCSSSFHLPSFPCCLSHSKAPHCIQGMDLNRDTGGYSLNGAHPSYMRKDKAGKKLKACGYVTWL